MSTTTTADSKGSRTKAVRVSITFSENRADGLPATFKNFAKANALLKEMAVTAPKDGAYDKTDFEIEFADGETYKGRIDLKFEHATKARIIEDHVRAHLTFYAGWRKPDELPSHLTPESYAGIVREAGHRDESILFLSNYRLSDR